MSGIKFDEGKPKMGLVPQKALLEVAKNMTFGASKNGVYNYLEGMPLMRLMHALYRHTNSLATGEDIDPESGIHHAAAIASNAMMILELHLNGLLTDDRPAVYKKETVV